MQKYIYRENIIMPDTVVLPAYAPNEQTKMSAFTEIGRFTCPAGFVMGIGWGENRGQVESTGRAYMKLSNAAGDAFPEGILRITAFDAAGIARTEPIELDSSELNAATATRGEAWKVFENRQIYIQENSYFKFEFMSYESAPVTITKAQSVITVDGNRTIARAK